MAVCIDDRLKQRTFERKDVGSVGRLAFGEHGDHVATCERGRSAAVDTLRVTFPRALYEQRSHAAEHSTDQRQTSKLRLRDKADRMNRVEDEDIQPRHVIRDEQYVAVSGVENTMQAHVDIQHS